MREANRRSERNSSTRAWLFVTIYLIQERRKYKMKWRLTGKKQSSRAFWETWEPEKPGEGGKDE